MQGLPYLLSMKKLLLLTVLCTCFSISYVFAQPYRSSLGILANTGLKEYYGIGPVFKLFFNKRSAAEANLFYNKNGYHLSLIYNYHFPLNAKNNFTGYIGAGLYNIVFPKATLGLEYKFENAPISIAADWRPYYIYFSDDDIDPKEGYRQMGVSIRYVLKK